MTTRRVLLPSGVLAGACAASAAQVGPAPATSAELGSCHVLRECFEGARTNQDVGGCPDFGVQFAENSTEIASESHSVLTQLARELREGQFSDVSLLTGSSDSEQADVAQARAASVREWLEREGVAGVTFRVELRRGTTTALWFHSSCARRAPSGVAPPR